MKPIFWVFVGTMLSPLFITAGIYASDIPPEQWTQFQQFLESLKGTHGLGQMGLAAIVVQVLMYFIKQNYPRLPGKWRIIILQGLSIAAGVLGLRIAEFDWASAFLHANTIGAFQVFAHSIWKEWTKTDEKYTLPHGK